MKCALHVTAEVGCSLQRTLQDLMQLHVRPLLRHLALAQVKSHDPPWMGVHCSSQQQNAPPPAVRQPASLRHVTACVQGRMAAAVRATYTADTAAP